jgi:hypothetical protein
MLRNAAAVVMVGWLSLGGVWAQGKVVSFRNLVTVGDSYMAGFLNGSLNEKGQNKSVAAFVARQVGTYHFLPLISEPGVPVELELIDPGPPAVVQPKAGSTGTRVLPLVGPQNLAVPGQSVGAALSVRPDLPLDSLEDLILGLPALVIPQLGIPPLTQIESAFALQPTFTLFWLGSYDVIPAILEADPGVVTPVEQFTQAFQTAVGTVLATQSEVVVGNIPDWTIVPYLTSAESVAALAGAPLEVIGPLLGIGPGDKVTPFAVPLVQQILAGEIPGPLPEQVVLTSSESDQIRQSVTAMNQVIEGVAQSLGVTVVDLYEPLGKVHQEGLDIGGQSLSTAFLGGIFSLDGIHLTYTGSAFMANQFLEAIASHFGIPLELVDLSLVASQDPLVPESGSQTPQMLTLDGVSLPVSKQKVKSHGKGGVLDSGKDQKARPRGGKLGPLDSSSRSRVHD